MKRRTMLLGGLAAGGALLVGWGVAPPRSRLGSRGTLPLAQGEVGLNGWIKIAPGGEVMLAMNRSEMGQGVHTALPMLVAEELDVPLDKVRLVQAGHEKIYGNIVAFLGVLPLQPRDDEPGARTRTARASRWIVSKVARELGINVTGGSSSVADAWDVLRMAAATARQQLLGAAALRWRLPIDELVIDGGTVSHPSGPKAHFGELAHEAANLPPGDVRPKAPGRWKLIGTSAPRTDVVAKSNGSAVYGLDVRLPGQLFAAVRMCPMLGGFPGSIPNQDAVVRMPGVVRLVRLRSVGGSTDGVAIVGRSTWHARRAVEALEVQWQQPPHEPERGLIDSSAIMRGLVATAREAQDRSGGFAFRSAGDPASVERAAAAQGWHTVEATYTAPYLAHATMEPMNCAAQWKDGRLTLWVPTQVPGLVRAMAARTLDIAEDQVDVHVTLLGGGFGRRLDADFAAQAALVATECGGAPVQLVWSREEDMTHDFYRPAGAAAMRAVLDAAGKPQSLRITSAGDAMTPRWMERVLPALSSRIEAPDKTAVEGLFDLPYAVPNARLAHVATHSGVPVGNWRSVGHSHNAFFSEGFVNELAHAAGQDPVAWRLAALEGLPRHAAVLRLAAEKSGWGTPLPAGRARGVALHESYGSIVAEVVEASIEDGQPRVHSVTCAIDCGIVVNPGIVAQQMESAIIFGLSAALFGRIDIVGGAVKQRNFPDYPIVTLAHAPVVRTFIVPSMREPSGAGEPATPPLAPALADALFVLSGQRLRDLPLKLA